ncbi:MAG: hypothetical protein AB1420_14065 [Bacillota bacterium]
MSHLTWIELESLRHLIGDSSIKAAKYQTYAQTCNDSQLKNHFNSSQQMASQSLQTLKQFLS